MGKVLTYDIPDYKIKLKIRQLQVMGKKNTWQINPILDGVRAYPILDGGQKCPPWLTLPFSV